MTVRGAESFGDSRIVIHLDGDVLFRAVQRANLRGEARGLREAKRMVERVTSEPTARRTHLRIALRHLRAAFRRRA